MFWTNDVGSSSLTAMVDEDHVKNVKRARWFEDFGAALPDFQFFIIVQIIFF